MARDRQLEIESKRRMFERMIATMDRKLVWARGERKVSLTRLRANAQAKLDALPPEDES
jgi:hypothetical protein